MSNIPLPTPKRTDIHHIPPEILCEMFAHCPSRLVDSAYQSTPQILSSVCRSWRALVLATSALWASLDITCNPSVLRPSLPAIHTHLQRSQTHPLSFILRADDSKYDFDDNPNIFPVLAALAAARRRWRNVDIKLAWMDQDILDLIMLGDAPLLQSINCEASKGPQTHPIPLRMVHHCPRLESFQWFSVGSSLLLPLVNTSLTLLSLQTCLCVSECIALLRLSPRLSSAEFYTIRLSDPSPTPYLIHSTLCTLTGDCIMLLTALTLPSLSSLDLMIYETPPPPTTWDIALSAFLERNHSTLHQLSLFTNMQSPEPALVRTLTLTPHLRTLRLSSTLLLSDVLIRALHPQPLPNISLCPRLQGLLLSTVSDCPNGLSSAMLRARWGAQARANGVACLEWAHIKLAGGVHDRDHADMVELRAEGMRGGIVH